MITFHKKGLLVLLILLCISSAIFSQAQYIPLGSKDHYTISRLEIFLQKDSVLNFSSDKPYNAKVVTQKVEKLFSDSLKTFKNSMSSSDIYNIKSLLSNNSEWVSDRSLLLVNNKPLLKCFYSNPSSFYEYNSKDFFIAINPVLQFQYIKESNNSQTLFTSTRGIAIRGTIAKKLSFYSYATDNQEREPLYIQNYIKDQKAIPGVANFKDFKGKGSYDYFDARGGLNFTLIKYLDVQFAYDKNFIGNGLRSILLSDFGAPYMFLKLSTRIWKFNYSNMYMELTPQFAFRDSATLFSKKYAVLRHLSINAAKWLTVGFFESIIYGRKNELDFSYFNPVIFLQSVEGNSGGSDNYLSGFDIKVNAGKQLQFYGQLLLDEFKLKEILKNSGWWANKYGYQLGLKYTNVAKIKNLDVQIEFNKVRPFTYSHRTDFTNYSHYNLPLAHPLGSNFHELIGYVNYQPLPGLSFQSKVIFYAKGNDTGTANYGNDIFKSYSTRSAGNYGYQINNPSSSKACLFSSYINYEVYPNIFLYAGYTKRSFSKKLKSDYNSEFVTMGLKLNIFRREFDF